MKKYIHLIPEKTLPEIADLKPFKAILVIDETVSALWQDQVSHWIVDSGCLYLMAWGKECSVWHDAVDEAQLEKFNYRNIPDDQFILTTWHEKESLKDVFWFSKYCADHEHIKIKNTLIIHITCKDKSKELLGEYGNS